MSVANEMIEKACVSPEPRVKWLGAKGGSCTGLGANRKVGKIPITGRVKPSLHVNNTIIIYLRVLLTKT